MGKHALPRTPSRARRAVVVSSGTFLLCLCAASPALADIGPIPVPEPVDDVVDQASDTLGIPNPLDTVEQQTNPSKPAAHHHKAKHRHEAKIASSTLTTHDQTPTQRQPARHAAKPPAAPTPTSYPYGGMRGFSAMTTGASIDNVRAPVTAGVAPAAQPQVADTTTTFIRPAAAAMLDGAGGENGPRVLLLGLAAMVVGGLSAGHIKVAQDRIAELISA